MNNAQHTPGPWGYRASNANASHEIYGAHKEHIASTGIWSIEQREEQRANACLIAASPKLLVNCKQLCELLESIGHDCTPARTAIKEAEGY